MKKLWLVAVAGLTLSTSVAFAADLGQPAAPLYKAPPAPPPPGWTGFYIGVNGGWGFNQRTGDSKVLGFGNIVKPSGGLAGGRLLLAVRHCFRRNLAVRQNQPRLSQHHQQT